MSSPREDGAFTFTPPQAVQGPVLHGSPAEPRWQHDDRESMRQALATLAWLAVVLALVCVPAVAVAVWRWAL